MYVNLASKFFLKLKSTHFLKLISILKNLMQAEYISAERLLNSHKKFL